MGTLWMGSDRGTSTRSYRWPSAGLVVLPLVEHEQLEVDLLVPFIAFWVELAFMYLHGRSVCILACVTSTCPKFLVRSSAHTHTHAVAVDG